jgi:hypothetical protein
MPRLLGQHLGHGAVGFGRGGGAEFQRVAEDAGQHRALHRVGHFRRVIAHQVVHDRGGAGDGPHGDVDRPLRLKPADQLVVVDDRRMSAAFTSAGSSAGLLVSTMTTGCPASTPSMMAGLSRPQRASMKAASVLGSPRRTGVASSPAISLRYQAQMIGEPVLSVSGDLWPKTRVVMGVSWSGMRICGPHRRGVAGCHGAVRRGAARLTARAFRGIDTHLETKECPGDGQVRLRPPPS